MNNDQNTENRAERFVTHERAELEVYGRGIHIKVDLKNISATGVCVQTTQPVSKVNAGARTLKKGDLVRMTVVLNQLSKKHHINAEVMWNSDGVAGLQFINSEEILKKMMSRN